MEKISSRFCECLYWWGFYYYYWLFRLLLFECVKYLKLKFSFSSYRQINYFNFFIVTIKYRPAFFFSFLIQQISSNNARGANYLLSIQKILTIFQLFQTSQLKDILRRNLYLNIWYGIDFVIITFTIQGIGTIILLHLLLGFKNGNLLNHTPILPFLT